MSSWQLAVLVVILFGTILPVVFSTAQALLGTVLGMRPRAVSFNRGPKLVGFQVRGTVVRFNLLPLGSSVSFGEEGCDDGINRQPLLVQVVVILVGPGSLLLLGSACLGTESGRAFVHGFWQLPLGAVMPLSIGVKYVSRFCALVPDHLFTALGVASVKLAAANLLPIPSLAGFDVLRRLATRGSPKPMAGVGYGITLGILMFGVWVVAIGAYVFQGR